MKAIGILLFLPFISFSDSCLVVRLKPCACPLMKLDINQLNPVYDHPFYRNLTYYDLKQPSVTGDNCAVSVYCEGNYDLVVLDKDSTTNFGAYSADAICTASTQTWLVSSDDGGFKLFQRLYAICVNFESNACTPDQRRAFLLAYSNDFDESAFAGFYRYFNSILQAADPKDYSSYAKIRFDVEKEENFEYFLSLRGLLDSFVDSSYQQLPFTDPSLRFTNTSRGSDVIRVLERLLDRYVDYSFFSYCGYRILIFLKRWPDEYYTGLRVKNLIEKLRRHHMFIDVLGTETPSGGLAQDTMYHLATMTNGLYGYDSPDSLNNTVRGFAAYAGANLTYAWNKNVGGTGELSLPSVTYDSDIQWNVLQVTYNDRLPADPDFRIVLRMIHANASLSQVFDSQDPKITVRGNWFYTYRSFPLYAGKYEMRMDIDFPTNSPQVLQVRILSWAPIDHWVPYDM
ncbi:unnamed protein product [Caenorhabditis brenneri]